MGTFIAERLINSEDGETWIIENKYYVADVEFLFVDEPQKLEEIESESFQGCIFVFDSSSLHFEAWENVVKLYGNQAECTLIVGNQIVQGATQMKLEAERAYDLGGEFIQLPFNAKRIRSTSLMNSSSGIDRIIKAFECVMWRNMERQPVDWSNRKKLIIKEEIQ